MQYTYSYTLLIHIPIFKRIGDEDSGHCLWMPDLKLYLAKLNASSIKPALSISESILKRVKERKTEEKCTVNNKYTSCCYNNRNVEI